MSLTTTVSSRVKNIGRNFAIYPIYRFYRWGPILFLPAEIDFMNIFILKSKLKINKNKKIKIKIKNPDIPDIWVLSVGSDFFFLPELKTLSVCRALSLEISLGK